MSVLRQVDEEFSIEAKDIWDTYLIEMSHAWSVYMTRHEDYFQRRIMRQQELLWKHGLKYGEDTKYGTHTIVLAEDSEVQEITFISKEGRHT